ncbi:MAG: TetR/AcrR family transcriptional regulator [Neomegalonema sp.]|nr:TetR/AcrR family transcriptional regulator [Neomegalonema sp.]
MSGLSEARSEQTGPTQSWRQATSDAASPRERILAAAAHLFCHEGFAATGVDAIVAQAGAAKTTLYKHFESKEQLIDAVLEREGAAWRRWFFGKLGALRGDARARLLAVFDVLEIWFADPEFYGCPFINAIAEFDTGDERIRAAAAAHKAHLFAWLKAQALECGDSAPDETARQMVVLIDGAIVAAQGARDPSFARTAKGLASIRLEARPDL